jgi:hypothetical protein
MDNFVYIFTTNWELDDGPCHELTGVFESFENALDKYRKILQSDLNAINFDYNENLERNEDYLNHYIYENKGDRYIEYIIKKIRVE